jgi:hypothetical protein
MWSVVFVQRRSDMSKGTRYSEEQILKLLSEVESCQSLASVAPAGGEHADDLALAGAFRGHDS